MKVNELWIGREAEGGSNNGYKNNIPALDSKAQGKAENSPLKTITQSKFETYILMKFYIKMK